MEWWQISLVIAAAVGAASEIYLRLLPYVRQKQKVKQESKREIQCQLELAIICVQFYGWGGIGSLKKAFDDAPISKRLRRELNELIKLALKYHRWRSESFQVINAEVRAQSKNFDTLNNAFRDIFGSTLEATLRETEGSIGKNMYEAICKEQLTFDTAKELVLKDHWDRKVTLQSKQGQQKELMFKDIIDGGDFHKFIGNLTNLQDRASIRTLRDAQARFLKKAQAILKEAFNATI